MFICVQLCPNTSGQDSTALTQKDQIQHDHVIQVDRIKACFTGQVMPQLKEAGPRRFHFFGTPSPTSLSFISMSIYDSYNDANENIIIILLTYLID